MAFQWRRFQFFDKDPVGVPAGGDEARSVATTLLDFPHITAAASSPRHIAVANSRGHLRLINREFEATEWCAYDGEVTHLALLQRASIAITVGEDESQGVAIKLWQLDRIESHAVSPDAPVTPIRRIPCFNAKFPAAYVTSMAVLDDLSQCAIGLNNGQVILYDGNLIKDKQPKQSYIIKDTGAPITACYYRDDAVTGPSSQPTPGQSPVLFVVTVDTLASYHTRSSSSKISATALDTEAGGDVGLTCYAPALGRLVVGRRDGVHFYDADEKSVCFAFEGTKKLLSWFGNYLLLVTEAKDSHSQHGGQSAIKDQITIYDLKNKFIAYQGKSDPVQSLLPAFSAHSLFALTVLSSPSESQTHALLPLTEKDLSSKLEILFRKNLYPIAIDIAQSQHTDSDNASDRELLFEIYAMYGDHCLAQGDYDGAIRQYIETIGHTEPSYVIRQFLDAQRIAQLTQYLQALHERNRATSDHTTLLLNCYTKLKDLAMLEEFVKSDTWKFDVAVAIAVCRQAGYESHALYLANKFHKHREFITITLEKSGRARDASQYIQQLQWKDAEALMREFGKKLLTEEPELTTDLIIQLSTGWAGAGEGSGDSSGAKSNPDHYIHFFVDHPAQLQRYLEAMQSESAASHLVYNTLLELYLRQDSESESDSHSARVMAILKSFAGKYDLDHALVLCKLYKYEKGLLFLYAKLHFYTEILQYHIDQKQFSKIVPVCKKFGQHQKQLWVHALNFFAATEAHCHTQSGSASSTSSGHGNSGVEWQEEISQCLEAIERDTILTPVQVIQILSGEASTGASALGEPQPYADSKPFAVVKDYLLKLLRTECAQLQRDSADIRAYEADTAALKEELAKLTSGNLTFQQTKCAQCGLPLQLPVAHYLCHHSYHSKCVAEDVSGALTECPKCSAEFSKVRAIRASMQATRGQHDRFFKQIEDAHDGFQTVAEYFGRGVFTQHNEDEH